ncbi:MAG: hypothetical protein Q8S21_02770 [Candidatus Paracaedibacteraceae bacterium]|nr:hypothetical protein [Candidatus Paracaedibacteraceae bacterium]
MSGIKSTLIISLTTLILFASYIAYNAHHERFILIPLPTDKAMFVFDRKTNMLNYCASEGQCKVIKLGSISEHESTESIIPAALLQMFQNKNAASGVKGNVDPVTVAGVHTPSSMQPVAATSSANAPSPVPQPAALPISSAPAAPSAKPQTAANPPVVTSPDAAAGSSVPAVIAGAVTEPAATATPPVITPA